MNSKIYIITLASRHVQAEAASEDASLSSGSVQCEAVEQPPEARKPHLGFKALNDLRKSNSLVAVALRP